MLPGRSGRCSVRAARLRKLLQASRALPAGSADLVDGICLFDAQRASTLVLDASAATLSVRQAGAYLNAPRVQRDRLYRAGIVPRLKATDHGAADKFAPEDLDASVKERLHVQLRILRFSTRFVSSFVVC